MVVVMRAAICFTLAVIVLSAQPAWACTLLSVKKAEEAKHKVYFTKFTKEDNTGGKYKKCRIVTKAEAGTETFFVTPFRQDATVVVHKDNWP